MMDGSAEKQERSGLKSRCRKYRSIHGRKRSVDTLIQCYYPCKSAFQNRSWQGLEADETAAEGEEGLMDIGAALIAHGQAAEPIEPGEGALHHPAVAAEAVTAFNAFAGDAHFDVALPQGLLTAR